MEKRLALFVIAVFTIGTMNGILIGYFNFIKSKPKNINPEYYIELKPNSVFIEDINGNVITCPYNKISQALLRDNL